MFICTGSEKGVEIRPVQYPGENLFGEPKLLFPKCKNFAFSKDFSTVAFFTKTIFRDPGVTDNVIHICKFDMGSLSVTEIQSLEFPNIHQVSLSPKGNYINVIMRMTRQVEEAGIDTVQVIKIGGPKLQSFTYRGDIIPTVFWNDSENLLATTSSDNIVFTKIKPDGSSTMKRVSYSGMKCIDFCNYKDHVRYAVVFDKNPAKLKIMEFSASESQVAYRPCMSGTTFKVKINPKGISAIAIGYTKDGESYDGSSYPYYLNEQGQQKMDFKKQGYVHCTVYSPNGNNMIATTGFMPPNVSLSYEKMGTVFTLGEYEVNSAVFSPNNEIVAIGGFGNLSGKFFTVDIASKKTIGEGLSSAASEWSWSPCGRLLMTSTLYRKMSVANNFKIFDHYCRELGTIGFKELTQCEWVGFEDIKPMIAQKPSQKAAEAAPKPGVYVPRHLRAKNLSKPPGF